MRTYIIQGDKIAVANAAKAAPAGATLARSAKDLDPNRFPVSRLVGLWNALPGAEPVKRFTSRETAVKRIWQALERLPAAIKRPDSKQARVIAMLRRPNGASIDDLAKATGWQRHTVRGVLSGTIKKKLGLPVTASKDSGITVYRIAA